MFQSAVSVPAVFGSDPGSIGNFGSCWAQRIHLETVAPPVNIVGKMWQGDLRLGQVLSQDANSGVTNSFRSLSVQSLIAQSSEATECRGSFDLHSVIKNMNLVATAVNFESDDTQSYG